MFWTKQNTMISLWMLWLFVSILDSQRSPFVHVEAQSGFTSIDCGSSQVYDDKRNVTWHTDEKYLTTGESRTVLIPPSTDKNIRSQTLRSFPKGVKNCYKINVTSGSKYLVRTTYYYGNYDGKNSPPSFDLIIDANVVKTVKTQQDGKVIGMEIVWTAKKNIINICLGKRFPDQIPFITSLQLRQLDEGVYNTTGHFLILQSHYNLGEFNKEYRYPNDKFDRLWDTSPINGSTLTSNMTIDISNTHGLPPQVVMSTAIAASNPKDKITIPLTGAEAGKMYFLVLYFAELQNLGTIQRSFDVLIDGEKKYPTMNPTYLKASEYSVSQSMRTITLVATPNSTVGPIVNAMELFLIGDGVEEMTLEKDVKALEDVKSSLGIIEWNGDPCMPESYGWEGVTCTKSVPPRVTKVNLSNRNLSGVVPDAFVKLTELTTLDLRNNNFSAVPQVLTRNNNIQITICGNPYLEGACNDTTSNGSATNKGSSGKVLIYVSLVAAVVVIALLLFIVWRCKERSKEKQDTVDTSAEKAMVGDKAAHDEFPSPRAQNLEATERFQEATEKIG